MVDCRDRVASVHYGVYCWSCHSLHDRLVGKMMRQEEVEKD